MRDARSDSGRDSPVLTADSAKRDLWGAVSTVQRWFTATSYGRRELSRSGIRYRTPARLQTQMNDNELAIETPPPNPALLTIEQRLYLMAQLYHIMLCVFLLCQCKSRKTLNPKITLQDLTNAINRYADAHRTELNFLTQHADLSIEPKHVEFAPHLPEAVHSAMVRRARRNFA